MPDAALLFVDMTLSNTSTTITDQLWAPSIAAELVDTAGNTIGMFAVPVRADGRRISEDAAKRWGISNIAASRDGVDEAGPLGILIGMRNQLGGALDGVRREARIVAFDVDFVFDVVLSLYRRRASRAAKWEKHVSAWVRPGTEKICLKSAAAQFTKIPSQDAPDTYRYPTLDEAGEALCGLPRRVGFHGAYQDAVRAKAIYLELVRRGAIEPLAIGRAA